MGKHSDKYHDSVVTGVDLELPMIYLASLTTWHSSSGLSVLDGSNKGAACPKTMSANIQNNDFILVQKKRPQAGLVDVGCLNCDQRG